MPVQVFTTLDGTYTILANPSADLTLAFGINASGQIVGMCRCRGNHY
jgi:hypothetical protein